MKSERTYITEDGKVLIDRTYDSGSVLGELPAPTREGYDFGGWYDTETGETVTPHTTINRNTIYVARWITPTRTVVFDAQGGLFNQHMVVLDDQRENNQTGRHIVRFVVDDIHTLTLDDNNRHNVVLDDNNE